MALSARTNLRGKVVTRFPARVLAGSGITITKANGVYTFALTGPTSGSFDVAFGSTPGTYLRRGTLVWAASAIIGDDLPNPSTTTKGGVLALPSASNQVLAGISTAGLPQAASVTGTGSVVLSSGPLFTNGINVSGGIALESASWASAAAGVVTLALPHILAAGTLSSAASDSALKITQTWNTSGTVHPIDLAITNTASNAASTVIRLRAGAAGATEIFAVPASTTSPVVRLRGISFFNAPSGSGNAIYCESGTNLRFINAAGSANLVSIADSTGVVSFYGTTSGSTTIAAAATASGALTLPAATDTLVGKATTDTFTNKTYDTAGTGNVFKLNGTQVTTPANVNAQLRVGLLVFTSTSVNANSANSDNAITITLPTGFTKYRILACYSYNPSISLTTATAGLFTSTGGGGTTVVTNVALAALTTNTADTSGSLLNHTVINSGTAYFNDATLYYRIGTAQGAAATVDVALEIQPLP